MRWPVAVDAAAALALAQATGGELVSIGDLARNDLLTCLRNSKVLGLGPCDGPWIGLERTAAALPGTAWHWHDLSPLEFTRWAAGMPAVSVRLDATAALLEDGSWTDSVRSPEAGSEIRSAAIAWPAKSDGDGDGVPDSLLATGIPAVVIPPSGCTDLRADLDGDGRVNSSDIAIVLAGWGSDRGPADLNHDGIVNSVDLGEVLAAWTGD